MTHTQLFQAPRERTDPGGGTRQRRPPGSRRPPPWRSALEFAAGRGPALSWMCAPAEPRERHGLRVEHLEQQLARSPAVYHRKGRPGTRASVNCSNALFLGREPAARRACALGNPEFGEGEAWGERHMVGQAWRGDPPAGKSRLSPRPALGQSGSPSGRESGERLEGAQLGNAKNLKDAVIATPFPPPGPGRSGPSQADPDTSRFGSGKGGEGNQPRATHDSGRAGLGARPRYRGP